ncbi:MAG: D-alanine--D-alanine ligase [Calditrichota bacterium]
MPAKLTLGIIFGGRSVEHEVSILTGHQVLEAIDRSRYEVVPVYLARDNAWFIGEALQNLDFFRQEHLAWDKLMRVYPGPDPTRGKLRLIEAEPHFWGKPKMRALDCVLPATHGTFVEDGALQGIFEMADVPVAGSGVAASAVGMDKLLTKAALAAAGLPFLPYYSVENDAYVDKPEKVIEDMLGSLSFPLIVKPAKLGSSVAVGKAHSKEELSQALDLALRFGSQALVEPLLINVTEVNCAVLDGDPPLPSVLEQPISEAGALTFEEKYKGGKKGGKTKTQGMAGQKRLIPAPLAPVQTQIIQEYAVKTFRVLKAGGVARVDFLIDAKGNIYVNELNNIPGSLAYYLWEYMGRSFRELIDRMVERALEVHQRRRRITYAFESNLLARKE